MDTQLSQSGGRPIIPAWPDDSALTHYLAGESNPAETALVKEWLAGDPENAKYLEQLRTVWSMAGEPILEKDPEQFIALFKARREVSKTSYRKAPIWRYVGIAASLLIAAATVKYADRFVHGSPAVSAKTYTTRPGQRAEITLPDGSRVILSVASSLTVNSAFNRSSRTVHLNGQAHFAVSPNKNAPFIVHTDNTDTRVLGTSFTVHKYWGDKAIRVVVSEGRVAVQSKVVSAGEGIDIGPGKAALRLSDAEVARALAWTSGRLVFENEPARNVLTQIERWYGVTVSNMDGLPAGLRITTEFTEPMRTQNKLNTIGAVAGVQLVLNGKTISIKPSTGNIR